MALQVHSGGSRISHGEGGAEPLGGANLQHMRFLAKTYAKTKELDPLGRARASSDPRIRQWSTTTYAPLYQPLYAHPKLQSSSLNSSPKYPENFPRNNEGG